MISRESMATSDIPPGFQCDPEMSVSSSLRLPTPSQSRGDESDEAISSGTISGTLNSSCGTTSKYFDIKPPGMSSLSCSRLRWLEESELRSSDDEEEEESDKASDEPTGFEEENQGWIDRLLELSSESGSERGD